MKPFVTPKCPACDVASVVELEDDEYGWLTAPDGPLIQDALPNRDASFRELVKTGTHSLCWDAIFNSDRGWTVNALVHLNLEVNVKADSSDYAMVHAKVILETIYPNAALVDVVDAWPADDEL